MTTSWSYVLVFLLMLMGVIIANDSDDWVAKCNKCRCHWKSAKRTADCRDTGQRNIPTDLHTDIQLLDLSNNYIAGEFSRFHIDFPRHPNFGLTQFSANFLFSPTQKSKRNNCPTTTSTISTSS
jgi:hypothetical protein